MTEGQSSTKSVHTFRTVLITVALTLILGGGVAYFLGYVGPQQGEKAGTIPSPAGHPAGKNKAPGPQEKKGKILYWQSPMNPTEIYDKPGKSVMGMDLVPVYEDETSSRGGIRINPATQQNMGVRLVEVKKGPLIHTIRTYGNITPDETLTAQVSPKTSGWIEKLQVDFTGKYVKKGEPLFEIYSPELVAAQEEYLVATKEMAQLGKKTGNELLQSARRRLLYFDVPESEILTIRQSGTVRKTLMIRSPLSGFVIERSAEEGSYIRAGTTVFRVADLSRVWVDAHIYEYELSWIAEGQEADMTLPYLPGKVLKGRVSYVYPYLQPKTRDLVIRLAFENPEMSLKPDMYADVVIKSRIPGMGLIIPSEAVIRSGQRNVVFVARGKGYFTPRDVILGPSLDNDRVQVLGGLMAGEEVVSSGQFLLDSESNLKEAIQKMLDLKIWKTMEKPKAVPMEMKEE